MCISGILLSRVFLAAWAVSFSSLLRFFLLPPAPIVFILASAMPIYSAACAVGDEARRSCELPALTPLRLSCPGTNCSCWHSWSFRRACPPLPLIYLFDTLIPSPLKPPPALPALFLTRTHTHTECDSVPRKVTLFPPFASH